MLVLNQIRHRFSQLPELRWRQLAIGVIVVVACVQLGRVWAQPQGDFHLHWRFGQRLVAGEYLYDQNGLDLPYLPFWAVAHAPLSFLPMHTAQRLLLPMFLVAAFGLFWILKTLSARSFPTQPHRVTWAALLTILLASRFLVRDILECGANLALVALAWAAVWCWRKRRDWAGGTLLGFAIALKLTPALFLAWFAWKRQWKLVMATTTVAGALFFSPLFFMDWPAFANVHAVWWDHASNGLLAENPNEGVLGEESIQNVSLRPALGRFLVHLPVGHNARFEHPWAIDFLNLSPRTAGWVVRGILAMLVFSVAWRFRQPVNSRTQLSHLWEAAAVSVLILLLSPLTWGQHCVGLIPAVYLLVREAFHDGRASRVSWAVLMMYSTGILLLNRGLIGKQATYLLDSYFLTTWCLMAVLWLVLRSHGKTQAVEPIPPILPLAIAQPSWRKAA